MNQEEFEERFCSNKADKISKNQKNSCSSFTSCIYTFAPILHWLPNYSFKKNFHGDLVAGLTVGIMVVPQGMAYTTLAGVSPIYGLYSCLFSAFIYMFFGTSRHISVGTFAVASMMVGTVQSDLIANFQTTNSTLAKQFNYELTPILVTTSLTFFVGVCQLLMGLCRLSFLTNYISDPLVSGFTTGAAVHVLFSQMEKVFGVKIPRQSGIGTIIKMSSALVCELPNANLWAVGISIFGITFLSIGRDYVNPGFKKRFGIPLPLELFLVVISIIVSMALDLNGVYNVKIVAHVPQGFPVPALPKFNLFFNLWQSAITISVICYIFVFSMGKIFAKKHKYKVDSNQELYALGIAQIISSLFPVYPSGASLSRSSLCETTGAKTQLHALFSSMLLLVVILWVAPLLEPLPMAILACIVIVSLKNLFLQFGELSKLWLISRADFCIWLVSFFTTTFVDVTAGLVVGVFLVIFSVVLREQWPKIYRLHATPNQDIFKSADKYTGLLAPTFDLIPNRIIILKFDAPLHFANCVKFVERCSEMCAELNALPNYVCTSDNLMPANIELKTYDDEIAGSADVTSSYINVSAPSSIPLDKQDTKPGRFYNDASYLIVDAACIAFIDSSGIDALNEVYNDCKRVGIYILFAEFNDSILHVLKRYKFFTNIPKSIFFPTVKQAMLSIENMQYPDMIAANKNTSAAE